MLFRIFNCCKTWGSWVKLEAILIIIKTINVGGGCDAFLKWIVEHLSEPKSCDNRLYIQYPLLKTVANLAWRITAWVVSAEPWDQPRTNQTADRPSYIRAYGPTTPSNDDDSDRYARRVLPAQPANQFLRSFVAVLVSSTTNSYDDVCFLFSDNCQRTRTNGVESNEMESRTRSLSLAKPMCARGKNRVTVTYINTNQLTKMEKM